MTRAFQFGIYCSLLALLVASGVYASLTHAQEGTTTPGEERRDEIRAEMAERKEAIQENMAERRAELSSTTEDFREQLAEHKAAVAQKAQDRIYNLTQNIRGRMSAAVRRLENIAGRIESRTDKIVLDEAAKNVVRGHVADARTSLTEASGLLAPDLGLFIQSNNPREAFGEVFSAVKEAGQHIRTARESLRAALATLKGIPTEVTESEDAAATSTEGIEVQ